MGHPLPTNNVKFTQSTTVHDYVFNSSNSSSNILSGLTNGQPYNVTVRARSSVGYSLFSYSMGPFIPATVPDAARVNDALATQATAQKAGLVSDSVIRIS